MTTSTTQITYIGDHADRMVADALFQDQNRPILRALLQALGEGAQLQEDQFFDLLISRGLNVATGEALNQWGRIVGSQRGGLSDDDYRKFIKARILGNLCEGTPDQLLAILALVSEPSQVRYFEHFPAGFRLQVLRDSPLSDLLARRIGRLMRLVKPAGVGMSLTEALTDSLLFSVEGRGFGSTFSRLL